jgi:hypothetical protein
MSNLVSLIGDELNLFFPCLDSESEGVGYCTLGWAATLTVSGIRYLPCIAPPIRTSCFVSLVSANVDNHHQASASYMVGVDPRALFLS